MADQQLFRQFILKGVQVTENELGRGSYAVVLELNYQGLKCAGKKLYQVLYEAGIGYAARRYLDECRILSQTRHPNIVQFLGVYFEESSNFPILVMEFLPTNLTSSLNRYGILPDEISYSILYDVSLGLAYLHGQTPAITHRDLSANNVLLSTNMTAKISDLGVARILNLRPDEARHMTGTPGTPVYMPPEAMVANPHYDTSMDVFSYGTLLIHTFTAEWPLPEDEADVHMTDAERRQKFAHKIAQDHSLTDLMFSCLKNKPQQRPKAEVLVERLKDLALQFPPSFENRVEMLHRITSLTAEKRQLEQEIAKKNWKMKEKSEEVQRLTEIKRQIVEDNDLKMERYKLRDSVQIDQLTLKNEDLRKEVYMIQTLAEESKTQCKYLEQRLACANDEIIQKETIIAEQEAKIVALNSEVSQLNFQLSEEKKSEAAAVSMNEITTKLMESRLLDKEDIIQGLSAQLIKIQHYLTSTQQVYDACKIQKSMNIYTVKLIYVMINVSNV